MVAPDVIPIVDEGLGNSAYLVELGDQRALVVVRNADQDLAKVTWQALKIGFRQPSGELAGGIPAWDGPTTATALIRAEEIGGTAVLDVRQLNEFDASHIPGATHIELGDLPSRIAGVPPGPVAVMCGHGQRAMTARQHPATHRQASCAGTAGQRPGLGSRNWARASVNHRHGH